MVGATTSTDQSLVSYRVAVVRFLADHIACIIA
jgi:hypothetical protein